MLCILAFFPFQLYEVNQEIVLINISVYTAYAAIVIYTHHNEMACRILVGEKINTNLESKLRKAV